MKKTLCRYGGLILFYAVIIIGVLLLNLRFSYINNKTINLSSNYKTMN